MVNRQFLLTFLDVMETRNFAQTAGRLNITQSTVSARIKELEVELSARLFERGRGGAEPTAAGVKFEAYCSSALALWAHACRDVGLDEAYSGSLHVHGQLSFARDHMLEWVALLRNLAPNISIYVEANFSNQIQRDLLGGVADIGIVFAPSGQPDLQISQVGLMKYVMLSTRASAMEQVDAESYIKVHYTPSFLRYHDERLGHLAHPPLSAGSDDVAVGLVTRFGGSLYLPCFSVDAVRSSVPALRVVEDAPTIPLPIYSAVHVRKCHDPLINAALKSLRDFASARS